MDSTKAAIAEIVREHWVEKWDHPTYASAVRCMKEGCDWEGQFPGDIADHVADLVCGLLRMSVGVS